MSSEGADADASTDASLEALTSDLQQLAVSNPQESVFQDADLLERLLEALHPAEPRDDAAMINLRAENATIQERWKEAVEDIADARCVCLAWRNAGSRPLVVAALQYRLISTDAFCGALSGMRRSRLVGIPDGGYMRLQHEELYTTAPAADAEKVYTEMRLSRENRGAAEWMRAGYEQSVNSIICDSQRAYRSSASAMVRFLQRMKVRRILLITDESTLEAWKTALGADSLEEKFVRGVALDGFYYAPVDGQDRICIWTWTSVQRRLRMRRLSALGVQAAQLMREPLDGNAELPAAQAAYVQRQAQLAVMQMLFEADPIFESLNPSLVLCDFAASWAFEEEEAAAPATPQEAAISMASGAGPLYRARGCDYILAAGAGRRIYARDPRDGDLPAYVPNWVMLTDRLPEDAVGLGECLKMMTCHEFEMQTVNIRHFGDEAMRRWSMSLLESSGKEALSQFVWNSDDVRKEVPKRAGTASSALRMWRDGWGR